MSRARQHFRQSDLAKAIRAMVTAKAAAEEHADKAKVETA